MEDKPEKRVLLQFYPFSSMIDASFWHELSKLKLEKLRLSDAPIDVSVTFQAGLNSKLPSLVNINYESFLPYNEITKRRLQNTDLDDQYLFGQLMIFNTLDEFNSRDKRQLIIDAGKSIWEQISDESLQPEVDANLELHLSRFLMIVFADLKRYSYHYWCSYPSLNYPPKCFQLGNQTEKLENHFSDEQLTALLTQYSQLNYTDRLYFVVILSTSKGDMQESVSVQSYSTFWLKSTIDSLSNAADYKIFFSFIDPSPHTKYPGWPMRNYIAYLYVRFAQLLKKYPADPNVISFTLKSIFSPCLQLLSVRLRRSTLRRLPEQGQQIVENLRQQSSIYRIVFGNSPPSLRSRTNSGNEEAAASASLSLQSTSPPNVLYGGGGIDTVDNARTSLESFFEPATALLLNTPQVPPIVGWERNPSRNNQLLPRFVDCSHQLDPKILSNDAVHLNLKLMKWRLVPNIDLDVVRNTRCLLLGAGTLGCNISRSLMAWGVSKITFVDNGTISYSNPVRQTLYNFKDCIPQEGEGGKLKPKAIAAAEALRLIYPGIQSEGIMLSIPMPGHPVMPAVIRSIEDDVKKLEVLIQEHDVIFLLMDTRESRWLPTLIAASLHKTVINVALGFDTFLVQRHGLRLRFDNEADQKSALFAEFKGKLDVLKSVVNDPKSNILMGCQLGCYYCNDVFAPGNTTRDRTLDQQCTVTRPGISMIASGYAAELLASLLQHPAKALAPALASVSHHSSDEDLTEEDNNNNKPLDELTEPESILGLIPHQIRGFISRTEQITPSFRAFDSCTACSYVVIDKYRQEGFNFLLQVFNDSTILEDITGLKQFHTFDEDDIYTFDSD